MLKLTACDSPHPVEQYGDFAHLHKSQHTVFVLLCKVVSALVNLTCPALLSGPTASEYGIADVHIIKLSQPANGAAATKLPLRNSHWLWSFPNHVQGCLGDSSPAPR